MELNEFKNRIFPLRDKLYRFALSILHSREDAEDLVQEVLLKIWNAQSFFERIDDPTAYCMMMTKNMALDRLRQANRKTPHLPVEQHDAIEEQTPLEKIQHRERLQLVERIIRQLPQNLQMLIQLRDIEGESYQQIGHLLKLSESQIKTNLFRARQLLKQRLNNIHAYGQL
ncbi:MAG: sigma-70 family RNA polymerase sigma factor [Prevotellaceae bacterium]|jgi:RNA polymerase sigma-70 factor (ECF subfamily)|nr:sigma-70 family RNA polymerase sigma factor [Prevotellaceae bacterium]